MTKNDYYEEQYKEKLVDRIGDRVWRLTQDDIKNEGTNW